MASIKRRGTGPGSEQGRKEEAKERRKKRLRRIEIKDLEN